MKVLVTGAAGHLGSVLRTRLLNEREYKPIFTIGMHSPGHAGDLRMDLADVSVVDALVDAVRPDAVVHLAGIVGGACEANLATTAAVNVDATRELALAADRVGASRFVFASTSAVYGDSYSAPAVEDSRLAPAGAYARSKVEAEQALRNIVMTGVGMTAISLRIFNIFGDDFQESLVYRLAHSRKTNPVVLRGLDTFSRDYVHADDVISAIIAALTKEPTTSHTAVNVGSGIALSNRALVDTLSQYRDVHYRVEEGPYSYSCADLARARTLLDFAPARRP
jgi:UDP-glucose 4-epimerase